MADGEMTTAGATVEESAAVGNVSEGRSPDAPKDTGAPLAELFRETVAPSETKEGAPSDEPKADAGPATSDAIVASDIEIPEGFTYDAEAGDAFLAIVNDAGLGRKEMAQKLAGLHAAQMGRVAEALAAAEAEQSKAFEAEMAREREEWMRQCQADPEFGGSRWDAAQAVIDRGARQLATPEAVALLRRYGLETHPELVRMFWRAGKLAGEDESGGHGAGGGAVDPAVAIFGDSLKSWTQKGAGQ
ncbi:MAG: hypothetical protein IJR14_07505 [Synergistaceae bacterium]|nr:hypothetical protein [Synergistaceae bacterium]